MSPDILAKHTAFEGREPKQKIHCSFYGFQDMSPKTLSVEGEKVSQAEASITLGFVANVEHDGRLRIIRLLIGRFSDGVSCASSPSLQVSIHEYFRT
jgi:hypothetical protein